jgi:WD40 repeat protein
VVFRDDNRLLATRTVDGRVAVWRLDLEAEPAEAPSAVTLWQDPEPQKAAADKKPPATPASLWTIFIRPEGVMRQQRVLPNGNRVERVEPIRLPRPVDLGSKNPGPGTALSFSPGGQVLALGDARGVIRILEAETGQLRRTLQAPASDVYDIAFSPDGRWLASCAVDGEVRLWDWNRGTPVVHWPAGQGEVRRLAFSPDGTLLATAGNDVRVWHVPTRRLLWNHESSIQTYFAVTFTGEGRYLAAGSASGQSFVFDLHHLRDQLRSLQLGW